MMNHNDALIETDWLLQEAYKKAVRITGITDWSKVEQPSTEKHIELLQVEIAKIIQRALYNESSTSRTK